jgi:hypothetical protein
VIKIIINFEISELTKVTGKGIKDWKICCYFSKILPGGVTWLLGPRGQPHFTRRKKNLDHPDLSIKHGTST